MGANEEADATVVAEHDALDEVALSSVNQALEAVENETLQDTSPPQEEPIQTPRNIIPELDEVEDSDEMVEVLLTVGEERSRRGDIKGRLRRSTRPSPSTLPATWLGSTAASYSKLNKMLEERVNRSKSALI